MLRLPVLLTMLGLAASPLLAAGGLGVDARFDRTGDGIVDASDWAQMDESTRKAYAYESLAALGEDPYTSVEGQVTRGDRYLQGLRSVYE